MYSYVMVGQNFGYFLQFIGPEWKLLGNVDFNNPEQKELTEVASGKAGNLEDAMSQATKFIRTKDGE